MPFKECSLVSQREEFCRLGLAAGSNVRALCRRFGVSPTTGYKWIRAYRALGAAGLSDRSRRPLTSPGRTAAAVEAQVMTVRTEHPCWGGRKIQRVLERQGLTAVPAPATITEIVRRHGALNGPGAGERRDWVPLRARRAERSLADGLQGLVRAGPGTLSPADGAGRPFALRPGDRGLRRRDGRDGARAAGGGVPPLRPALAHSVRQRPALGNSRPWPAQPAQRLADGPGHRRPARARLSSPDPGQGRALPSHPQGRGSGRRRLEDPRRGPGRLRRLAADLQHQAAPRGHRTGDPLDTLPHEPKVHARHYRAAGLRAPGPRS
jgi:transposase